MRFEYCYVHVCFYIILCEKRDNDDVGRGLSVARMIIFNGFLNRHKNPPFSLLRNVLSRTVMSTLLGRFASSDCLCERCESQHNGNKTEL